MQQTNKKKRGGGGGGEKLGRMTERNLKEQLKVKDEDSFSLFEGRGVG